MNRGGSAGKQLVQRCLQAVGDRIVPQIVPSTLKTNRPPCFITRRASWNDATRSAIAATPKWQATMPNVAVLERQRVRVGLLPGDARHAGLAPGMLDHVRARDRWR